MLELTDDQVTMTVDLDYLIDSAFSLGVTRSSDDAEIVPLTPYYSAMDSIAKQQTRDFCRSILASLIKETNILRPLPQGKSTTVSLAKLTNFGSQGSLTFVDGILTDSTNPT